MICPASCIWTCYHKHLYVIYIYIYGTRNIAATTTDRISITIENQILTYMANILRKKNKSEAYQREQIQSEQKVYDIGMTLCDFLHKVK